MRKTMVVVSAMLVALPVFAGHKKKEKDDEDRWKFSIGASVAPVTGEPAYSRQGWRDFSFRADEGLQQWVMNFRNEYLAPHGATEFLSNPPVLARCCATDVEVFKVGPGGFTGEIGDEYGIWELGKLHGIEEKGYAMAGSFEYRATGPFWLAFSLHRSRETSLEYSQTSEFFRVEDFGLVPCDNCTSISRSIRSRIVEFSRNRLKRIFRRTYRSTSFAALAKVDLTRGNPHWSVLPQAGVDLLVSSEKLIREDERSRWTIFDGENHGAEWARTPARVGNIFKREISSNRYVVRPVVGLALELYPAKKSGHFGILVDGRYHFDGNTSYEHSGPREDARWLDAPIRPWTLSLAALVRF